MMTAKMILTKSLMALLQIDRDMVGLWNDEATETQSGCAAKGCVLWIVTLDRSMYHSLLRRRVVCFSVGTEI